MSTSVTSLNQNIAVMVQKIQYTEKTLDAHSEEIKAIKEKVYADDDNASSKKNLIIEQEQTSASRWLWKIRDEASIDLTGYSFATRFGEYASAVPTASLRDHEFRANNSGHLRYRWRTQTHLFASSENSLLRSRRYQHFKSKIPHPRVLRFTSLLRSQNEATSLLRLPARLRISLSSMTKFLRITSLRLPSEPKRTWRFCFRLQTDLEFWN